MNLSNEEIEVLVDYVEEMIELCNDESEKEFYTNLLTKLLNK